MTSWRIPPVLRRQAVRSSRNTCSIPCHSLANQSFKSGLHTLCRCSSRPCPLSHVSASCYRRRSGVRSSKRSAISSLSVGWLSLAIRTKSPSSRYTCAQNFRCVCRASKLRMRPLTVSTVKRGLSSLISLCFSCILQCQRTLPVATSYQLS